MKKTILSIALFGLSLSAVAESTYIEKNYTVALSDSSFESGILQTKTLTPIMYKKYVLPANQDITFSCKDGITTLIQVANYSINETVTIGNLSKIGMTCAESISPNLFWTKDEIKIKSDAVQELNNEDFQTIPFNVTNQGDGKITGLTSNGILTKVLVNKSKYFENVKFYATINGKDYYIQANNDDDDTYTLSVANFSKLITTDANGEITTTITTPNQ